MIIDQTDIENLHADDDEQSQNNENANKIPADKDLNDLQNEEDEREEAANKDNKNDGTEGDNKKKEPEDSTDPQTGLEKFLAQYGVEGGMIEFEGGVKKHFSELQNDEQLNVLKDLVALGKTSEEEKYGLNEHEIGAINFLRENNMTFEQAVEKYATELLSKNQALQAATGEDFKSMDKDAVYLRWLKASDPEASEQDLTESLEAAKKLKTFDKSVEKIRTDFVKDQESIALAQRRKEQEEEFKTLEAEREEIVNEVQKIKHVAGWDVTNDQKNEILGELLEVNDSGDSKFLERVFSNPETLFRVAWMEKHGEAYFDRMAEHYKNEISAAYKRGRTEAIGGMPPDPIDVGGNKGKGTKNNGGGSPAKRETNNAVSFNELHDDKDE
jgi:hypothetical protein